MLAKDRYKSKINLIAIQIDSNAHSIPKHVYYYYYSNFLFILHLLSYGQCVLVDDSWPSVGHGSDESDPSGESSCRARGKVLLVGLAGVTDVDVGVDKTRETDDRVGGDTVNIGLHGRGVQSKKIKCLEEREDIVAISMYNHNYVLIFINNPTPTDVLFNPDTRVILNANNTSCPCNH